MQDSIGLFRYYKKLGERAMAQCPDEALFVTLDAESNSIALIVKHMSGNMRSRWVNFLTTDGEKPDRNRDTEFESPVATRAELIEQWEHGWRYLFDALEPLTDADLTRTVTIRTEPHTVMQAINRQVAHYAHHVGQILFLAKHLTFTQTGKWESLSVPRGKSAEINAKTAAGEASARAALFASKHKIKTGRGKPLPYRVFTDPVGEASQPLRAALTSSAPTVLSREKTTSGKLGHSWVAIRSRVQIRLTCCGYGYSV